MKIAKKYERYMSKPVDCPIYDKKNPDYRCSVDYDKTNYRKNKALSEASKEKISFADIYRLVNIFLIDNGIESKGIIIKGVDVVLSINYEIIKRQYRLNNQSDIVWMKFTEDGYLGVVASSNDINFNDSNNSFKLINHVGKKWDKNLVLIVPLPGIAKPEDRCLIERMIGNYLSDNNVPIIDYYSHNL